MSSRRVLFAHGNSSSTTHSLMLTFRNTTNKRKQQQRTNDTLNERTIHEWQNRKTPMISNPSRIHGLLKLNEHRLFSNIAVIWCRSHKPVQFCFRYYANTMPIFKGFKRLIIKKLECRHFRYRQTLMGILNGQFGYHKHKPTYMCEKNCLAFDMVPILSIGFVHIDVTGASFWSIEFGSLSPLVIVIKTYISNGLLLLVFFVVSLIKWIFLTQVDIQPENYHCLMIFNSQILPTRWPTISDDILLIREFFVQNSFWLLSIWQQKLISEY